MRFKNYFKIFPKKQIFIIGSRFDKKFAESNGYNFLYTFPIATSVAIKVYNKFDYFLNLHFKRWLKFLNNKKVKFFLYEDTQFVGSFLSILSKHLLNSRSVCLQHGFFMKNYNVIPDGKNTDYNFLWEKNQIKISNLNNCKIIGLDYVANAIPSKNINVIFVSSGEFLNNEKLYYKILKSFSLIRKELKKKYNFKYFYRPHPSEYMDTNKINYAKNLIGNIDSLNKVQRLNGCKSIFIGCQSSLMFEAGYAGHVVAYFDIPVSYYKIWKPSYKYDFKIIYNQYNSLYISFNKVIKNWFHKDIKYKKKCSLPPLARFKNAVKNI